MNVINRKTGEKHELLGINVSLMLGEPTVSFTFSKGKNKPLVIHSIRDYYLEDNVSIIINKDKVQIKENK